MQSLVPNTRPGAGGGESPYLHPNMDIRPLPSVDIQASMGRPLPFPSDTFGLVFSRNSIEHLSWRVVPAFLKECYRISRPGGWLVVNTVNSLEQCRLIALSKTWNNDYNWLLFGGQVEHNGGLIDGHLCGFSPKTMAALLFEAGFVGVEIYPVTTEFGAVELLALAAKGAQ